MCALETYEVMRERERTRQNMSRFMNVVWCSEWCLASRVLKKCVQVQICRIGSKNQKSIGWAPHRWETLHFAIKGDHFGPLDLVRIVPERHAKNTKKSTSKLDKSTTPKDMAMSCQLTVTLSIPRHSPHVVVHSIHMAHIQWTNTPLGKVSIATTTL